VWYSTSTYLLGFHPPGVSDQQGSVVLDQSLLQLQGGRGILVLGVVGNDTLGDGLSQGVHLGDVTTTGHSETDVDVGELVGADGQDGLVDLVSKDGAGGDVSGQNMSSALEKADLRLDSRQGLTVETDHTLAGLDESHGGSGLADKSSVPRDQFLVPSTSARRFRHTFCKTGKRMISSWFVR
jgi:hypothetical protein